MKVHEFYINRCLELAKNGLGTTYPNPMVGCVIVHNHTIIGEGWHQKSGEAHAEVKAINSVKNKALLSKSTLYVSNIIVILCLPIFSLKRNYINIFSSLFYCSFKIFLYKKWQSTSSC